MNSVVVETKYWEVVRNNGLMQRFRYKAKCTVPSINPGENKLAVPGDITPLRGDLCARYRAAKRHPFSPKPYGYFPIF